MKIELRKNKNGTKYYSFVYYDHNTKKPRRITKYKIKERFGDNITDYGKAIEACGILEAEVDSLKSRIKNRVSWENEFYNFSDLLAFYEKYQKKKAPNSYKNNLYYLKYYVLPYFLNIKKCNQLSLWEDHYVGFVDWLEDDARLVRSPEKPLSYASKNHSIKALNTFMKILQRRKIIPRYYFCESFPSHTLNEKGIDDIIQTEEMEKIYQRLIKMGAKKEALFFRFLFFTGMRFNEALGVHPGNLYSGQIENKFLTKYLEQEGIGYFGYVVISAQPCHKSRGLRNTRQIIEYKPLKGRKRIDDKSARTVVITDKTLWNDLVSLHNEALKKHQKRYYGNSIDQYPLFDGIDKSSSSTRLRKAYEALGLYHRSWHCCRHTRATMLIGETANPMLARLWLGHSSEKVLQRYVHTYEAIVRSAKKKKVDDEFRPLDFIQ